MIPTLFERALPAGYRFMLAHEAERIDYADPIKLFNGELIHGTVIRHTDEAMRVQLRSGAHVDLDLDHPDYWPDGESRDRHPPMSRDGEFVAVQEVLATPDVEVEPLLRTSIALAQMAKGDPELAAAVGEIRRIILNRLKGRVAA